MHEIPQLAIFAQMKTVLPAVAPKIPQKRRNIMVTEVEHCLSCTETRDQTTKLSHKVLYILTHVAPLSLVCILVCADRQGYYNKGGHCIRDKIY